MPFEVSGRIPNSTTVAAMDEFVEMKKDPGAYKKYPNFKTAMDEVLKDA